jgi:hypothetical protein
VSIIHAAGWTVDAVFTTTSTFLAGIIPTSSPNALQMNPAGGGNTIYFATYGTADSNSGNVSVQCNFNPYFQGTHCRAGVTARGSASALNITSTTFYRALLGFDTNQFAVQKVVSGTVSSIGSPLAVTGLTAIDWFTIVFTLNGTSLSAGVQNLTNSYWLNSSGNFTISPATAISVTDSSITGSGYAGLTIEQNASTGDYFYADDWIFSSLSPPGPLPRTFVAPYPFQYYPHLAE